MKNEVRKWIYTGNELGNNEYEKQALDFLKKTGSVLEIEYIGVNKNPLDILDFSESGLDRRKEGIDTYFFKLKRGNREMSGYFSQSVLASGKWIIWDHKGKYRSWKRGKSYYKHEKNPYFTVPSPYCVLACLNKNEVGTLNDFVSAYGYADIAGKNIEHVIKVYEAVKKEYEDLTKLYNDKEILELQEIY